MKKSLVWVLIIVIILILGVTAFFICGKKDDNNKGDNLNNNNNNQSTNISGENITISLEEYPSVYTDLNGNSVVSSIAESFLGSDASKLKNNLSGDNAYANLIDGNVQIIYGPLISEKDQEYADEKGVELNLINLTNRAIVFVVNSENTNIGLSVEELMGIYSGKIKKWNEVGGVSNDIIVYQRGNNTDVQKDLVNVMMEEEKIISTNKDLTKENIEELIKEISEGENAKYAIGFAYLDEVQKYLENNKNIKILSVDGADPSEENISNNTYPVNVEGYLAIKESDMTNANVQKWLDAAFSSKGKEAIRKAGFVAVERISEE